jgi:hypothetical protein
MEYLTSLTLLEVCAVGICTAAYLTIMTSPTFSLFECVMKWFLGTLIWASGVGAILLMAAG